MPFNPNRLSIARKRRMLNKKGFAERVGVTLHTTVRWEKGETEPPPEILDEIASVLGYPVQFFTQVDVDVPDDASFRSYTTMSAAIREASLAAGSIGFLIDDWVEGHFDLPSVSVPDLHLYGPEEAASALRQEWALGEKPISNMIQLLESKGVRVFSLAENTTSVNAYSLWRRNRPYVFLNTVKTAESSRFDAAHELGHLVLHQDGGAVGREAEDQANKFASALLLPRSDILASVPVVHSLEQLIRAKARWRVSLAALVYRLHKLNIISDWRYRDFCIELSKRGYNRTEPAGIERERSVVWQKILKSLWSERKTQADIARDLCIPESEVNDLIFGVIHAGEAPRPLSKDGLHVIKGNE